MLDMDLAVLYGVQTKVLNQAVKRNIKRFPKDFMFRLTLSEWKSLQSQFVSTSVHSRLYAVTNCDRISKQEKYGHHTLRFYRTRCSHAKWCIKFRQGN